MNNEAVVWLFWLGVICVVLFLAGCGIQKGPYHPDNAPKTCEEMGVAFQRPSKYIGQRCYTYNQKTNEWTNVWK